MTTIVALKTKKSIFLAADSQVTSGNLKLPLMYNKIVSLGDKILLGGTGSVGNLQQALKRTLTNLFIGKSLTGNFSFEINLDEFVKSLADFNFEFPLEYKHFSPYSYVVAGMEDKVHKLYSIDSDGSQLEFPEYFADGSGQQLALSMLKDQYDPNMGDEEAITLIDLIFKSVTNSDIYTNDMIQIFSIDKSGKIFEGIPSKD